MAVGDGALLGFDSYVAIGRETALGTYNTCTSKLCFLSSGLKTSKEAKILEEICSSRTYKENFSMSKVISGDMEFYYRALQDAPNYVIQQAFGGAITTATATGETAGGLGFSHTVEVGSMDVSYTSLCVNVRKGNSNGQVFEYSGVRVNELNFSAEIDEPLMVSASLIGVDSTATSNDVQSALSADEYAPLSFVNGRISVETTFAGLTSTSFWHVQSVEFGLANNLKSDAESRRIGSDVLSVLPAGIANMPLNMTVRFDTTTAYDAMLAATKLSCELEFQGDTMAGSVIREGIKFVYPEIYVNEAGDPEIGGPDEILTSEISFNVVQDTSSASGYALQAVITNLTSSYA